MGIENNYLLYKVPINNPRERFGETADQIMAYEIVSAMIQ
jgi:hypothetical protein